MSGQNQQWTQNNGQTFTNYANAVAQLPQATPGMLHPITRDQYERNNQVIAQQDAFLRQHIDALARVRIQNEVAYHGAQHIADRITPTALPQGGPPQPMVHQQPVPQLMYRQEGPAARIEEIDNSGTSAQQTQQAHQTIPIQTTPISNWAQYSAASGSFPAARPPAHSSHHPPQPNYYPHEGYQGYQNPQAGSSRSASSGLPRQRFPNTNFAPQHQVSSAQPSASHFAHADSAAPPSQLQAQPNVGYAAQHPPALNQRPIERPSAPRNLPTSTSTAALPSQAPQQPPQAHKPPIVGHKVSVSPHPTSGSQPAFFQASAQASSGNQIPAPDRGPSSQAAVHPQSQDVPQGSTNHEQVHRIRFSTRSAHYWFAVPDSKLKGIESLYSQSQNKRDVIDQLKPYFEHQSPINPPNTATDSSAHSNLAQAPASAAVATSSTSSQMSRHTPPASSAQEEAQTEVIDLTDSPPRTANEQSNGPGIWAEPSTLPGPSTSHLFREISSTSAATSMPEQEHTLPMKSNAGALQEGAAFPSANQPVKSVTPATPKAGNATTSVALTPASERRSLVPRLLQKLKEDLSSSDSEDEDDNSQPPAKRQRVDNGAESPSQQPARLPAQQPVIAQPPLQPPLHSPQQHSAQPLAQTSVQPSAQTSVKLAAQSTTRTQAQSPGQDPTQTPSQPLAQRPAQSTQPSAHSAQNTVQSIYPPSIPSSTRFSMQPSAQSGPQPSVQSSGSKLNSSLPRTGSINVFYPAEKAIQFQQYLNFNRSSAASPSNTPGMSTTSGKLTNAAAITQKPSTDVSQSVKVVPTRPKSSLTGQDALPPVRSDDTRAEGKVAQQVMKGSWESTQASGSRQAVVQASNSVLASGSSNLVSRTASTSTSLGINSELTPIQTPSKGKSSDGNVGSATPISSESTQKRKRPRLIMEVEIRARKRDRPNPTPTTDKGKEREREETEEEKLWHELRIDSELRAALHPCKWSDCTAVLDSRSRLRRHLMVVHPAAAERSASEERSSDYSCQWSDCKKSFTELDRFKRHLDRHVPSTVACVYQGCEREFSQYPDLLQHTRVDHKSAPENDIRQIPNPWRTSVGDPPPMPETMPSYLTTNLQVYAGTMTKEHRKKLGPWLLRSNYGLPNTWRYLNNEPDGGVSEEPRESIFQSLDEYDFLVSPPASLQFEHALRPHAATQAAAVARDCILGQSMPKER